MTCSYSTLLPGAGTPQRQRKNNFLSAHPLGSQSRLSAVPAIKGRQTSQESHLHHCVLANLKEYHYRPFPSSHLPTTDRLYPGCPARLLRCDLFYNIQNTECCRSVIAPRLRLLKWLTYLDCWIWLAKHIVILCCSRRKIKGILSGICQSTMRRFPGETICPKKVPLIRYSHKITI